MPRGNDFTTPDSVECSPDSFPVTPDDDKNLPRPVRFLRCQSGGVVHVITYNDSERYMQFMDGETRFVAISKVFATGTTADGIEGMP